MQRIEPLISLGKMMNNNEEYFEYLSLEERIERAKEKGH